MFVAVEEVFSLSSRRTHAKAGGYAGWKQFILIMISGKHFYGSVSLAFLALGLLPNPQAVLAGAVLFPAEMQAAEEASGKRISESKLELGKAGHAAGRENSFPLHFTAAEGETVGVIRAEIVVQEGDFEFDRLSLPKDSRLKISTKKRNEENKNLEGQRARQTVIEATFSAGSRAIRNGLIGYLQLGVSRQGRAKSAREIPDINIRKLETSPPEPELLMGAPSSQPSSLSADPPSNPAVGCFFFTH